MRAVWHGIVLAESEGTREAGGYIYFPREAVRMEFLKVTPKTAKDLECPHVVQFFDVVADGRRSERAAWTYEAPLERLKPVDHWIGFWKDVEVS